MAGIDARVLGVRQPVLVGVVEGRDLGAGHGQKAFQGGELLIGELIVLAIVDVPKDGIDIVHPADRGVRVAVLDPLVSRFFLGRTLGGLHN